MTKPSPWRMFCTLAAAAMLLVPASYGDPPPLLSPSPSPKPTPAPTPTPPTVLYLLEETAVPIKGGLEGVPAGTEVKLVKDNGAKFLVSYNEHEFSVWKTQVTASLDTAAAVRKHAAALDAASEAARQQGEALFIQQQREQVEFLRTHPLATPTPTPTPKS